MHSSAHPNLPPAQPQQVIQFLLAKNYYLTALELLVESQQAGKLEEVIELQHFFSDQDRFPAEELAKHQNANAMDLQAQSKEREERLSLIDYELRLAKEDLAEMKKRLELAEKQAAAANAQLEALKRGSVNNVINGTSSHIPCVSNDVMLTSNGSECSDNLPPIHPVSGHPSVSIASLLSGKPSDQDIRMINGAVLTYLSTQGLKMTALTLQEEAAEMLSPELSRLPSLTSSGGVAEGGPARESQSGALQPNMDLWKWLQAMRRLSSLATEPTLAKPLLSLQDKEEQHVLIEELKLQLKHAQKESEDLRVKLQNLQTQSFSVKLTSVQILPEGPANGARAHGNADNEDMEAQKRRLPPVFDIMDRSTSLNSPMATSQPSISSMQHQAASILALLPDLLPKLVPNLTSRSRLEVLPLIQALITGDSCTLDQQRTLCTLVLNLISNPDEPQRQAIVQSLALLADALGPSWVSMELLPACVKQVNSPSSERRTLMANLLGSLCPRLDLAVQAHVLLTQLHRLAEDRIEQVREAAVLAVSSLLSHLPYFSRQYYQMVEEMLLVVAVDDNEDVTDAVLGKLLPSLQAWTQQEDTMVTALLPKVISEVLRRVQLAAAVSGSGAGQEAATPAIPHALSFQSQGSFSTRSSPGYDYQVANRLLLLFAALVPSLSSSALRACPLWALEALPQDGSLVKPSKDAINDMVNDTPALGHAQSRTGSIETVACRGSSTVHAAAAVGSEDARYLLDGSEEGRRCVNALIGAWAGSEKYMQWKIVQWTVQFLLPELVEVTRALPVLPDTLGLRRQLAMAWMAMCSTFGVGFAKTVIVPLVAAAAGTQSLGLPGGGTLEVLGHALPSHLQDSASDQVPSSSESVKAARERVLPQLLGAVLPAAGVLGTYIASTLGSPESQSGRWVLEALQELQNAVSFVVSVHGQGCMQELVSVVERLVGDEGTLARNISKGLGAVAVLRGLLPGAAAAVAAGSPGAAAASQVPAAASERQASMDMMKRQLMPLLMVLLSRGEPPVQGACVWALLDVLLRFGEDGKLVEQVTVVFDGLLESAPLDVAATVLNCGARLAAAVAPSASRSAASAGLLEWVLHAVQQLVQQLPAGNQSAAGGAAAAAAAGPAFSSNQQQRGPVRTLDQQRALAAQLVQIVHVIYSHDVRLPRLQTHVLACIEGLQRHKGLLWEQPAALLAAMTKEKQGGVTSFSDSTTQKVSGQGHPNPAVTAAASATAAAAILQQKQAIATAAAVPFVPAAAAPASSNSVESSQSESSSGGGGVRARFEIFRKKFTSSGQQQQQGSEVKGAAGSVLPPVLHLQGSVGLQYQQVQQAANTSNDQSSKHSAAGTGKFFSDDEGEP
ncbi:hypothetical protein CEUSTIGMA_g484.t1 [Chlamydomonas eustigma]|uniref:Uncharacterized protein n=1 Tax=Chlamydomonas eustigma TaxID=1157962 RepID=A0A250WQT6_9CHLO|nr:hypothetical protein CEUSTIGMA_g484.t1 [Chlamydomonas eustigma]|eukprot:GAX73032.1 hypothetical protein CEUSTIGMA_g484.t1 [Chlamydomonas eustigma]